jgi:RNA polymerase sigma-70 factor (ECF subfamily)
VAACEAMMAHPKIDPAETGASEAALVARALAREPAALAEIMRANNRRLYRAAWGILRDEQEAEDAVQDCYLKAFAALSSFRGEAALSTWLTRIAINEALMRRRKRQAQAAAVGNVIPLRPDDSPVAEVAEDPALSPESAAMRAQLRPYLEDAVGGLPEDQRAVFVLRALEELSVEETAQVLGLNPQTVRTRFLRARRKLQDRLQRELKLTFGEMLPFAGARCDRLIQRVLALLEADRIEAPTSHVCDRGHGVHFYPGTLVAHFQPGGWVCGSWRGRAPAMSRVNLPLGLMEPSGIGP